MYNCNCDSNCKVKCNVCECIHNANSETCSLETIEISHECTGDNCVSIPHFCKSYCKK